MAVGIFRKKLELNPELEALRCRVLKETAKEKNDWILRTIYKTSFIHAGFLFEDLITLQNLCLFIGETQSKITDAGWESFGYHLGLNPSVLKVIKHNNFIKEDPCYNVLLAYVQLEDASVGKIIRALNSMGRIDVLTRIQPFINDLADKVSKCFTDNDISNSIEKTNDCKSLSSYDGNLSSNNFSNIQLPCQVLIKPKVIPPAPFIFQNLQATPEFISQRICQVPNNVALNFSSNLKKEESTNNPSINSKITCEDNLFGAYKINIITEKLQSQAISNNKQNVSTLKKQRYGMKILLTFAEDGEIYAANVCKVFRKKRDNYPKIGVLILSEHADIVNKDPQLFISGSFSQVDYVCPILTSGYFQLISKKQKASLLSNTHIDAAYAPYIFRLMNSYFVSNNCLNDKIRSIIPENEFSSIPFKSLWTNPIFGAWVKLTEVDDLAIKLLKNERKKFVTF